MDAPTPTFSLTQQILAWINGLSLPTLLLGALGLGKWLTKKEEEAKTAVATITASVENLKTNHLHHIQETLDGIKTGQDKMVEQMSENTRDMVEQMNANTRDIITAQNSSKDAIVNTRRARLRPAQPSPWPVRSSWSRCR